MTTLLSYNVKKMANDDDGDATTDKLKYTPKTKQKKKITQTPTHQNRTESSSITFHILGIVAKRMKQNHKMK